MIIEIGDNLVGVIALGVGFYFFYRLVKLIGNGN